MSSWSAYPDTYRQSEVSSLRAAVQRGECCAVLGLSGAGKSNLLGFLVNRAAGDLPMRLIDCNRLPAASPAGFWQLAWRALVRAEPTPPGARSQSQDEFTCLESSIAAHLAAPQARLCLVFDRFDALPLESRPLIYNGLRALRDDHKYALTYLAASRRPLDPQSELAELFFANTLWLGPLSPADARWSAAAYAARAGAAWSSAVLDELIRLSGGYAALLRAACEAYLAGCPLQLPDLRAHPAVQRRLDEFWAAAPTPEELQLSRLEGIPLLEMAQPAGAAPSTGPLDTTSLTAKELGLWQYLSDHAGQVCAKDDLIQAVWPEDRIFAEGIRDDSLAQLVRRLRQKVSAQAGWQGEIATVPGRGYRYIPPDR